MDQASLRCAGPQIESQLRGHQKVRFRGREWALRDFFAIYPEVPQHRCVSGGAEITVLVRSARLQVRAHGQKRLIIALRDLGETESRDLVASERSWRTLDIVQTYTLQMVGRGFSGGLEAQ